jgi:asparagine N-glycosylation enzyme membrane subunit Stt3
MLEFVWNNSNIILIVFLGVEFLTIVLSYFFPKVEETLSTIRYVVLLLANSFLFTVAIIVNRIDYLIISILLSIISILLIKSNSTIEVLEDFCDFNEETD